MEINNLVKDSIQLLREMVMLPSLSGDEGRVFDHITHKLMNWDLPYMNEGYNILVKNKYYQDDKPTLMLCAHIDTVAPCEGYTFNPFEPGDDPEVVYGLGSNDDGGCVVSMLGVMRYFYSQLLPINLLLVLSCEEETSGANGMHLLAQGNPYVRKAKWAIVGEPTCLKAAISERGLLVIDAVATGLSGHAGRGEGENAMYKAIDDIQKLRQYKFDKVSPTMGEMRMSINQINSGVAHNVTPDRCEFVIDVRPTDVYTNEEIMRDLKLLCSCQLTPRAFSSKASVTKSDGLLLKSLKTLDIDMFSSPTTSDWMELYCDAVKIGPGDSQRSHKKDEYILVSEISDAVNVYVALVQRISRFVDKS
jgi:acetylornithine deacetylase